MYDPLLQQEMDVIITVLNRLFDENNKELYIGNSNNLTPLHNNLDNVLKNINIVKKKVSRRNVGVRVMPLINNENPIKIMIKKSKTKLKNPRNTRKIHK